MTPFHYACKEGSLEVVKLLCTTGARADLVNKFNQTPYQLAWDERKFGAAIIVDKYEDKLKKGENNADSSSSSTDSEETSASLDVLLTPQQASKDSYCDESQEIVLDSIKQAASGKVIADILTDATSVAVDEVSEACKVLKEKSSGKSSSSLRSSAAFSNLLEEAEAAFEGDTSEVLDSIALAKTKAADAFAITESAIQDTEKALLQSKKALELCMRNVARAIAIAEKSAMQTNISSQKATALAANVSSHALSSQNNG